MIRLTLFSVPPSLNKYLRMHWTAKRKLREDYGFDMAGQRLGAPDWPTICKYKRRVTITIYHSRLFDTDNAYGSVKPLVDALKDIGLLHNDSPKWLDLGVAQRLERKNPRTEIEIEDIR